MEGRRRGPPNVLTPSRREVHRAYQLWGDVTESRSAKRNTLRANGFAVLGVTDADLGAGSTKAPGYEWVNPQVTAALMAQPTGTPGSGFNQDAVSVLRGGPMDFLVAWIQQPHHAPRQALANAVWLLLGGQPGAAPLGHLDNMSASEAAQKLLMGQDVPVTSGPSNAIWWKTGDAGVLTVLDAMHGVPIETVVAIDDRDAVIAASDHAASWRRWLQMSNAFVGADHSVTLTSSTATEVMAVESVVPTDLRRREILEQVAPEWAALMQQVEPGATADLVTALASAGVGAPLYGAEVADGIPVDFAWPDERVVVVLDLDDATGQDLKDEGWRVVGPHVDAVVEALGAREGVR